MKLALRNVHSNVWQSVANVSKLWYRLGERKLSEIGITTSELRVLRFLSLNGACSMVTLARNQLMTPGGMTGLVDHLETQELIRRVRSETDRRVINIEITNDGKRVVNRATMVYQRFVERSLEGLTQEEIKSFLKILNKMISSAQDKVHEI